MLHPSALPKPLLQLPLLDKAAARLLSDAQFADLRKEMDAFRSENAWVEQSALFRCLPLGGGGGGGGGAHGGEGEAEVDAFRAQNAWVEQSAPFRCAKGWSARPGCSQAKDSRP